MTITCYDFARELDRLCPSQVDETISGNGQREAGHVAHLGHSDVGGLLADTIGWSCDGGNVGNAVCDIVQADVPAAVSLLRALPDGSLDNGGLRESLDGLRIDWRI